MSTSSTPSVAQGSLLRNGGMGRGLDRNGSRYRSWWVWTSICKPRCRRVWVWGTYGALFFSVHGTSSWICWLLPLKELPLNAKGRNRFTNIPSISISKSTKVGDKLEKYLAAPPEKADNPFSWWVKNRHPYPRLSRMALDYLSIPGESRQHLWFNLN